jgi:hypothetical protein
MNLLLNTAVDFHARLRFPRAVGEPPRRVCSCGVSPNKLFPQESSSFTQINSWNQLITTISINRAKIKKQPLQAGLLFFDTLKY